jgi:DNA polymerase III subunit gamma/tau
LGDATNFKSNQPTAPTIIVEESIASLPNKEVSLEEVKTTILNYADAKQQEGARQISTILKTANIVYANNTIVLTLNNETQKEQFLLIKQSFVDAIRVQLQNTTLLVDIEISKNVEQIKAYKPMDIFKAMSEKNPALLELKKRFDLEIDY